MITGLHFDAPSHIYTVDGVRKVSVTQALTHAKIIDYSSIPQSVLAAAGARGRRVHLAAQYMDEGCLDWASLDAETSGHLKAIQHFYIDARATVGMIEVRRYHQQYDYAGCLDRSLIIDLRDDTILDFKTGMVQEGHRCQLAGYTNFFPHPRRFRRIALQTFASGRYRVHEYPVSTFERDTAEFLGAVRELQQYQREQGIDQICQPVQSL